MKDDEHEVVVQSEEIEAPVVNAGLNDNDGQDVVFEESDEEGAALGSAQKVKDQKEKIKTLEKEKQEYLDGWQRSRADYANLQKSTDEDRKRMRGMIEENFIEDLIPVVDSFAMAMNNKEAWEKVDPTWRTGVEYISQQLMTVLKDRGFVSFGAVGETFDPTLHEAVSEKETDDEKQNHTIASVLQQGYKLGDNILRAARVSVYAKK